MMEMESKLDLKKLKNLIKQGINAIPKDEQAQEAIIVVGDTGVGKSTIMNFLAGNRLLVKSEGLRPKLVTEGPSIIKIGHKKLSETTIPTRVYIEDLAFYDCPGFRDNKGQEYEISNSFFVQRLLDIYDKVKIVLMIDDSHISEARADKLPRLTKNLLRSFKSFHDIQNGVILIINKADPDLDLKAYCQQIKKLISLKNEKGFLFSPEEQSFLKFLVDDNRIKLFRNPQRKDKGQPFQVSEYQRDIMPSIRASDFVKSKHILNIVSESAKIAIRDFIDDITIKSNIKIEKVSIEIASKVNERVAAAGKQISVLLQIKEEVIALAEEIRVQKGHNILDIIRRELPEYNLTDFEDDFESIMFFKGIYDKTETYFSNLINKAYSELAIVLHRLDTKIIRFQKEQQEELERKALLLKRQELQNQREKEKLETARLLREIAQTKAGVAQTKTASFSLIQELSGTLNNLCILEHDVVVLKEDTLRMQNLSQDLNKEFRNFSLTHLNYSSNPQSRTIIN